MYSYEFPSRRAKPLAARSVDARLSFIRKTYGLFFGGILSAAAGAGTALYAGSGDIVARVGRNLVKVPPVVAFVAEHQILTFIAFIGAFFAMRALVHKPVWNLVGMYGFTFLAGLTLGPALFLASALGSAGMALTANPARDAFLLATAAFGSLTAYALISRRDFSFIGGFLSMGLMVLLVASLIGMFVGGATFHLAIASVGVLLFGGFVLYDTSRLLHAEDPGTPVEAAVGLFLSFLNLFLFILQIFMSGGRRD